MTERNCDSCDYSQRSGWREPCRSCRSVNKGTWTGWKGIEK